MTTPNKQPPPAGAMTPTLIKRLNESVQSVLTQEGKIELFEKAYIVAKAIGDLKEMLTPEYMRPIMQLQGNKLGFKTDKDKDGGYSEDVVKNCVIEAVLMGCQVVGNQFNIIAGNSYITKEGYGHLLKQLKNVRWDITSELPRIDTTKGSAAIVMNIKWSVQDGPKEEKKIDFPIKVNSYMGADAVIGKATRKARKWLYDTITGVETPDGDTEDVEYTEVKRNPLLTSEAPVPEIQVSEGAKKEEAGAGKKDGKLF